MSENLTPHKIGPAKTDCHAQVKLSTPSQSSRERAKELASTILKGKPCDCGNPDCLIPFESADEIVDKTGLQSLYDQIAALEADKRRIDWLEKYTLHNHRGDTPRGFYYWWMQFNNLKVPELVGNDFREAIDAAIAQSK